MSEYLPGWFQWNGRTKHKMNSQMMRMIMIVVEAALVAPVVVIGNKYALVLFDSCFVQEIMGRGENKSLIC